MKTRFASLILAAAVTAAYADPLTTRPADGDADVPVKAVVLYSSGVGYFEHYGQISGTGSTELHFKTNQINDILKSLVLQDLDGGKVAAVTYPSQDPIAKTLKSFQVDITANPPLAELLNQLRGAKVTLTVNGGVKTTGVILGMERKRVPVKDETNKDLTEWAPVLNLVSSGKIVSQAMDQVSSVELDDPKLQDELNRALIALAGARDVDKKPVKINFTGSGDRHVRLGYVVETPIWKTSYRLILSAPRSSEDKPTTQPVDGKLQGWAIVENQTDNDWNNVELSLVSGRPISFIENLYQPLYIPRPTVEPELFASLRPQTYAGGQRDMQAATGATVESNMASESSRPMVKQKLMQAAAGRKSSPYDGQDSVLLPSANMDGDGREPMDAAKSVSSVASATSIGELFEYTVGSVTLPRQRSAMIPIITDPIDVQRVSIYNRAVLRRNPLNGAIVKNTTNKHLLAGPITVLDGSAYAGDAQIDNLPPGQQRLLSYGVDLQMLVDAADGKADDKMITGKIDKGVLLVTHRYVRSLTYTAENKSDQAKTLVVEHPRTGGGWELVDTAKPTEQTDAVYRFKFDVPVGAPQKLVVNEAVTTQQTVEVLPTDLGTLDFYRRSGEIPKPVQDALAKAIQLKSAVADTERQIVEDRQKLSDIDAEQGRIRSNINSIQKGGPYYDRLMTKLNDQETQIEKVKAEVDDLTKKRDGQRQDLSAYLAGLSVG